MSAFRAVSAYAMRKNWLWQNCSGSAANKHQSGPSRLLVDVSSIMRSDARTGIQRVVRAVWSQLMFQAHDRAEVVPVYATSRHGYCYAPRDFLARSGAARRDPVVARPGDKFFGLDLSAHLLPNYRAQLRDWRESGASIHLVVYDLLPIQRPEWFNPRTCANFGRWFRTLIEFADEALCISDHVAAELKSMISNTPAIDRLSINRIHMGADIEASLPSTGRTAADDAVLEGIGSAPAILMVGTIEPRKAYGVALSAFEYLWKELGGAAPELIIVGKPGWKTDELQRRIQSHQELGRRLHWLSGASDEALTRLYHRSNGLFLPSYAEGCGLPVLEAAAHGRTALVRDIPVFREKHLNGLLYFADDRPQTLAPKLLELAASPRLSELTALFTWSDSACLLMDHLGLRRQASKQLALAS